MKFSTLTFYSLFVLFSLSSFNLKSQTDTYKLSFYITGTWYGNSYPIGIFTNISGFSVTAPVSVYSSDLNNLCNLTDYKWNPGTGSLNDLAASADLDASAAGIRFTFYKNVNRDLSRGHTIVIAKKAFKGYHLNSFERTYEDEFVKVNFNYGYNGYEPMNGEVSSFVAEKF